MAALLRWLHLSDFHVGKDDYGQLQLFDELLAHIRERATNGLAPDLVIVSGDLANRGQQQEYTKLSNEFFLPLVDALGSNPRFYVVPGNHDVDQSQARIIQFPGILQQNPAMLDPSLEGLADRRTLMSRFDNFIAGDLFNIGVSHWLKSEAGAFTDRFSVDKNSVSVTSLNTAWLCHGDNDRHHLSPGKAIVEAALREAKGADLKLIIGHHPIDWFLDAEVEPIGALMGREGVTYLHGHLHRTRSKFENQGNFLALQAGAAFQARDSDEWLNRIMWVEADFAQREIRIEPFQWSRHNHEWTTDSSSLSNRFRRRGTDHWVVAMPEEQTLVRPKPPNHTTSPSAGANSTWAGWSQLSSDLLSRMSDAASEKDRILAYFDGRSPSWMEALHPVVPRREIVKALVQSIGGDGDQSRPSMNLLLGAGGEGKSTAIRQVAGQLALMGDRWKVMWHEQSDAPLKLDDIRCFKKPAQTPLLIVSDDGELIYKDVYKAVQYLHECGRRDVHFLLSARDTDWLGVDADQLSWSLYISFAEKRLRGLSLPDARVIVEAWSRFGQEGLGRLAGLDLEEAASKLVQESLLERSPCEGAFLGAMLRARVGEELKGHVASLLHRLRQRTFSMGTLADAFAYIAALHSENMLVLNKDVLAEAIGFKSTTELRRFVLGPLGEEAAVGSVGGTCILTRHRAIAETAVDLLSPRIDFDEIFVELVLAAVKVKAGGLPVPQLDRYEYLSQHFSEKGQPERSMRIALALVKAYPHNKYYITKLASLYREAGQLDSAVKLFRRTPEKCERDRAFFQEWAATEAKFGSHAIAACLYWFCLSDRAGYEPIRNDRARWALVEMADALKQLAEQLNDPRIRSGVNCAAYLCRRLKLDSSSKKRLSEIQPSIPASDLPAEYGSSMGLTTLAVAAQAAWEHKESPLPNWVQNPAQTTLNGLADLLGYKPPTRALVAR